MIYEPPERRQDFQVSNQQIWLLTARKAWYKARTPDSDPDEVARRMRRVADYFKAKDEWTPAPPTTPLPDTEDPAGVSYWHYDNALIDGENWTDERDVQMTYLYDRRKRWKRCNSDSRKIFFRSIGWDTTNC